MSRAAIELMVLKRMHGGPVFVRAFHVGFPVVQNLIDQGLVRRVAPPGGRAKNRVELTDAGLHRLTREMLR